MLLLKSALPLAPPRAGAKETGPVAHTRPLLRGLVAVAKIPQEKAFATPDKKRHLEDGQILTAPPRRGKVDRPSCLGPVAVARSRSKGQRFNLPGKDIFTVKLSIS